MPVLILAIASFVAFLGVTCLLYVAETVESRKTHRKEDPGSEEPFSLLSIPQAFDPVFAILWEAPIEALQLIESQGVAGLPVSRLRPIVARAATRFPEIYDGCSFERWIRFLERSQLILWNGQKVMLTREGRDFLQYRFVTNALVEA
jgi:hypothetical protein